MLWRQLQRCVICRCARSRLLSTCHGSSMFSSHIESTTPILFFHEKNQCVSTGAQSVVCNQSSPDATSKARDARPPNSVLA